MDELPLYRRDVLESLRAPLENGFVRIARAGGSVEFPCRFTLLAAMNPCPCGFLHDSLIGCKCASREFRSYEDRLSGPLKDRIDIRIRMERPTKEQLLAPPGGDATAVVAERVMRARAVQQARYGRPHATNASVSTTELKRWIDVPTSATSLLEAQIDEGKLSGRGLAKVLRLARTIADLSGEESIAPGHVGEALMLRVSDDLREVA